MYHSWITNTPSLTHAPLADPPTSGCACHCSPTPQTLYGYLLLVIYLIMIAILLLNLRKCAPCTCTPFKLLHNGV